MSVRNPPIISRYTKHLKKQIKKHLAKSEMHTIKSEMHKKKAEFYEKKLAEEEARIEKK